MAIHFVNASLLALFLVSLLPFIHSLSTVAIFESADQTQVCALARRINYSQQPFSFLNCMSFPQRSQFSITPPSAPVTGIVGGNGFLCALSSFYSSSSSSSVMVCWRFSTVGNDIAYKRIYLGPLLTDLASGNSHICGLVNGSHSLQCWQWKDFNPTANVFSSSLAVGDSFLCGLSDLGQVKCLGSHANITDHVPIGNFSQVKVGLRHACAVSLNGGLKCWGDLAGDIPRGEFTTLALGENRSCAIRPNGTVICWGENGFSLPESLRDESFVALEAKRRIFCGVVTSNISLFCWGNEDFDSNPLVFSDVVPGPCITREECACRPLIKPGDYCAPGLMICPPCVRERGGTSPPPAPPPWPPAVPPTVNPPPTVTPPPTVNPPPTVTPPPPSRAKSGRTWDGKMVAYVVAGSVGSFLSLLALCMFLFSRRFKITSSRIHDSGRLEEGGSPQQSGVIAQPQPTTRVMEKNLSHLISMGQLEQFSLEVLIEATENFSEDHKIGTGGFGSVYRATLEDNRQVAIKRAEASASSSRAGADKCGLEDRDSAFVNELEFLSRLNHKNLVRLFGYCTDCNERVLVYEYMDNGTLSDHLHKLQTSPLMSWPARIKAALDAARGIEYLHEYAMPRVIHRDIKPSNILLDTTWTAKVSDFGLSLMGPQDEEDHLSLRAAGTMGYMDPEYYRLQMLTTKSDVYSFGVVLLELLSGYKAIHKNENGVPRNVVDYVVPYITQDEIHRALDRRMPPPTPFEIEAVAYVGYLAADCVMPEGRDRPTMSEVVNSLVKALDACLAPPVLSRSTTASSTLS